MLMVLPFVGCQGVVNKSSTPEAQGMINAASQAKDFERLEPLIYWKYGSGESCRIGFSP